MTGNARNFEIARATTETDLALCFAIRETVFVGEQGVAAALERDGDDAVAIHLLARAGGVPLGTARALIKPDGVTAKIGRVAVLKPTRGTGLGKALMRSFLSEPALAHVTQFVLHAQVQAVAFYERLGYVQHGGVFDEAGIPHVSMILTMDRRMPMVPVQS